jgi:hypothetical protein
MQKSIEWLIEQIESDKCKTAEDSKKIFEQAKEMHEREIIKSYSDADKLAIAWKTLEWVGFTRGKEFEDNNVLEMLSGNEQ